MRESPSPPASPGTTRTGLAQALSAVGPGILFAGAAIGGSHLVQSTRAGASYGFDLVGIVVLALLFKYPFFEFSHRYTVATGESLLRGYRRLGPWALRLFSAIALVGSFIAVAAVTLVTASLAGALFRLELPLGQLSAAVLAVVAAILLIGRYNVLDTMMKVMVVLLGVLTVAAVAIAAAHGPAGVPDFPRPALWTGAGFAFLLALMGWMPAPVDVAVWPSLWTLEKHRGAARRPTLREASIDFHLGYVTTGVLALAFVSFGALVMFGTGETFSGSGLAFCHQLIAMYTATLGDWSRWLIALVAFITMFSTTLTVCDGYARTLGGCAVLLRSDAQDEASGGKGGADAQARRLYWWLLPILMLAGLAVIVFFLSGLTALMDVATILAFMTAPVVAGLNFAVVESRRVGPEFRPPSWLRGLAVLGIVYLSGFGAVFLYLQLRDWLG